jgi:alkylmercury lyase-like protein
MPLTDLAERVRITIYRGLAETGSLPAYDAVADRLGASRADVDAALGELEAAHHIVVRDGQIVLAHPFATRSFRFSVMGPSTLWWGGCCWDAFAIPHLVDDSPEVLVATTCPACGTPHAWVVSREEPPAGDQVAHFLTPAARVWDDVVHACSNQQIFCSEDCVTAWLERTGHERGYVMSLATLWRLAAHWYEGRLDSPYERREPVAAAEYFRSAGLHGPFWGLPEDDSG